MPEPVKKPELPTSKLLAPDGYTRYVIAARVTKELFGEAPLKVLDIGGKNTLLWKVLAEEGVRAEYTILGQLDGESTQDYKFVKGTGAKLPFEDNAFDVVLSTDVLEHVDDKNKQKFLKESLRVTKSVSILAAPFESEAVDYAERQANNFYRNLFDQDHKWLAEHFECKKPEKQQIGQWLEKNKIPYVAFGSNNLEHWTLSVSLNFMGEKYDEFAAAAQKLNAFYNANYKKLGDTEEPAYRSYFVMFKDKSLLEKFSVSKITGTTDQQKKISWQIKIAETFEGIFRKKSNEVLTLRKDNAALNAKICEQESQITVMSAQLQAIMNSRSWKLAQLMARIVNWPLRLLRLRK